MYYPVGRVTQKKGSYYCRLPGRSTVQGVTPIPWSKALVEYEACKKRGAKCAVLFKVSGDDVRVAAQFGECPPAEIADALASAKQAATPGVDPLLEGLTKGPGARTRSPILPIAIGAGALALAYVLLR